jgi:hypothetical protein
MRPKITPLLCSIIALSLLEIAAPGGAAPQHGRQNKPVPRTDPFTAIDPQLKAALATAPKSTEFPDSDAASLLDISDVEIKPDGTVVETVRHAYKLFNQRARTLAEIDLPYNSGRQHVDVLAARTIKANGTVVPVKREDIRTSTPGQEYAMYGDAVSTGFSMPAIEDNCVIDYTYRMVQAPKLLQGQYAATWLFASRYPVKLSRLTVHAPAAAVLGYRIKNDPLCKPMITLSPNGSIRTTVFEDRDIKPIVPEPLMPNPLQVAPHVELSTISSWGEIAKWYSGLQPTRSAATPAITATVGKITGGKTSPRDKAAAIYDWVVSNVRSVGVQFGLAGYRPHPAAEVASKRYGDARDKTNLLIAMLAVAGISADPVLLAAGIPDDLESHLPSLQAFNHCIALAHIEGKDVWLDASAEACPYGDIPQADRGAYGFVVSGGKHVFKRIPPYQPEENGIEDHETIQLTEDGSAEIEDRVIMRGSFAQGLRAGLRRLTPQQREQAAKQMVQALAGSAVLKRYTFPDARDSSLQLELKFSLTVPQYAQQAGDLLLVPFAAAVQPQNPFVQEKRVYPFYQPQSMHINAEVQVTVPNGFVVSKLPANVSLASPINEQRLSFTKSADGTTVTVAANTLTKEGTAPVEAYKQIQDYYKSLARAAGAKIVLKKAGP